MASGARVTVFSAQAKAEAARLAGDDLYKIAQRAAGEAIAAAPVLTGAYRGGIHAVRRGDQAAIVDDDPDAGYKEYGTVDTPAHATLTDAARRYGRYRGITPR